ncbi:flagellar motor protein MotB [Brumimicrobium salinarum]|uniref:Flagellar motor protein MotB n=1 Tax=Brumimicrobium salinarum TaxID=2058658 RepID=A0A2I0R2K2_9FLAO|nr:OmpA family protein [Brumimicrobium salinarum]PKR80789.1 flagellar motor protein MotB [Brumimicrobium salinarum]
MRNKNIVLLAIGTLFSVASCAPIYKCGEEKPEGGIQGSNRLLDVVDERDELCEIVEVKEKENEYLIKTNQSLEIKNDSLIKKNREIVGEYNELENNYEDLQSKHRNLQEDHLNLSERFSGAITNNLNQGHLFDERIKEKERRLTEKENALAERERRINELEKEIARQDSIAKRLNQLLREALLGFEANELSIEIKDGKVYVSMSDKLMFKSGKAEVQDKGKQALKVLADVLKRNTEFKILVEGHTDNVPIKTSTYKDNWDLSVARATSMVRLLQEQHDISAERLTASGRGEYDPKASNSTASGRAKNRRTEIILSPDLSEVMNYLGK